MLAVATDVLEAFAARTRMSIFFQDVFLRRTMLVARSNRSYVHNVDEIFNSLISLKRVQYHNDCLITFSDTGRLYRYVGY
jgi:hypothetical protein